MIVYCQAISIAITITYPLFSAWSTAAAAMVLLCAISALPAPLLGTSAPGRLMSWRLMKGFLQTPDRDHMGCDTARQIKSPNSYQ
jgi:hypothetical protein